MVSFFALIVTLVTLKSLFAFRFSSTPFSNKYNKKGLVVQPDAFFTESSVLNRFQALRAVVKEGEGSIGALQSPDKKKFSKFFKSVVNPGQEVVLDQLLNYDDINELLTGGYVSKDEIEDLWVSVVADAKGLNEEEAYEMLCMVGDLPDPENIEFLDKEFKKLSAGKSELSFFTFINWDDVKDMINEEALSMEEITDLWRDTAGDLNAKIKIEGFRKLNMLLDDKIEENESEGGQSTDSDTIDVWAAGFEAKPVFDEEALQDITDFFIASTGSLGGKLSYESFMGWSDIQDMISEGSITQEALKSAWGDAVTFYKADLIDYDTFLRLNVKLDFILDELESDTSETIPSTPVAAVAPVAPSSTDSPSVDEAEQFYRSEFLKITGGGNLMRLDMLLEWKEVKDLLSEGVITEAQVKRIFQSMPQEPMGIPVTATGINENTFITLNNMLDLLLDASSSPADGGSQQGVTPAKLIGEDPLPMPKSGAELKMGTLGGTDASSETDPSVGLSPQELEMMEMLDQADNMLNSGSFSDFDQLIGDVNDPRLAALREKRQGALEVEGEVQEILQKLLTLARAQGRCGLDKIEPQNEDDDSQDEIDAKLRDLVQAVVEKAPPLAQTRDVEQIRKSINGRWKLLHTNSEMFQFYNGVTGFVNVLPASKFQQLSVEYVTDGFASDTRYFEKLSTPLGDVDVTAFGNWDVVKEMSFMTNANSVVLRNYCTKVTAGPMEYEAQENWKSLRALSMNELVYVDDKVKIVRNCGALRIYFIFEKEG